GTFNFIRSALSFDTFVDRARITVLTVERFINTPDLRIATVDRARIAIDARIDRHVETAHARIANVCCACIVVVTIGVRLTFARRNTLPIDADLSLATVIIVCAHSSFTRSTVITVPEVCVRGMGADGDRVRVVGIAGGNMANGHLAVRPFLAWAIRRRETGHRHTQTTNAE
ncbi:MAG: hypothetical protein IIA01_08360, partial [Proteobacteria bacterium]|nr:hypothetical protein [Pseudomonadota bacterium]